VKGEKQLDEDIAWAFSLLPIGAKHFALPLRLTWGLSALAIPAPLFVGRKSDFISLRPPQVAFSSAVEIRHELRQSLNASRADALKPE
jgi:hypothetical protein